MKSAPDERTISEELEKGVLETLHEIRSNKPVIPLILLALCVATVIFYFIAVFPLIKEAHQIGQTTGEMSGQIAGLAVGSVEGGTRGIQRGYQEGKEAGLSAKDTTAEIANKIETNIGEHGHLVVLGAKADLSSYHTDGKKYGALFILRGNVKFSLDLSKIDVTFSDKSIAIVIPSPSCELTIDYGETKILAEWERKLFSGKAEEGFDSFLNSVREINSRSLEEIDNYDQLKMLAEQSAVRQIEEIAKAARGDKDIDLDVIVQH